MNEKHVRRATAADVPALTRLRNDAHQKKISYGDHAWGKPGDGFSERWVRNNVEEKEVYVVERAGDLIASFSTSLRDEHWPADQQQAIFVHGLSVATGHNGQGLGIYMLDWCASRARGLHRSFVRLDCAVANDSLCAFYVSVGFVQFGTDPASGAWALFQKPSE